MATVLGSLWRLAAVVRQCTAACRLLGTEQVVACISKGIKESIIVALTMSEEVGNRRWPPDPFECPAQARMGTGVSARDESLSPTRRRRNTALVHLSETSNVGAPQRAEVGEGVLGRLLGGAHPPLLSAFLRR